MVMRSSSLSAQAGGLRLEISSSESDESAVVIGGTWRLVAPASKKKSCAQQVSNCGFVS